MRSNQELARATLRAVQAALETELAEGPARSGVSRRFDLEVDACLGPLPRDPKALEKVLEDLPEELQEDARRRHRTAIALEAKRAAALAVIPEVVQRTAAYRAFDAALASPGRLGSMLGTSALAVIVGGALGYGLERVFGVPYATWVGLALGLLAFLRVIGQGLRVGRSMTQAEGDYTRGLEAVEAALAARFADLDRQHGFPGPPAGGGA
ncbi:MAG: hypothetical protein HYY54_09095 [candidate division NC10 bacterium]|nr:hypothetical protein [candidate division NC10 bacterium]